MIKYYMYKKHNFKQHNFRSYKKLHKKKVVIDDLGLEDKKLVLDDYNLDIKVRRNREGKLEYILIEDIVNLTNAYYSDFYEYLAKLRNQNLKYSSNKKLDPYDNKVVFIKPDKVYIEKNALYELSKESNWKLKTGQSFANLLENSYST